MGLRHIFYVILLFVVLLMLLPTLPVQIRIVYEDRGSSRKGQVKVGILKGRLGLKIGFPPPRNSLKRGLIQNRKRAGGSYKLQVGVNRSSVSFMIQWRRWRNLITGIKRSVGVFKLLLRRSVCSRLLWETGFGLDDYAATGMITGLIWAGKGVLLGTLSRNLRIRPAGVRVAVVPQFGGVCYASNLDCILETSLGHIILVACKLGAIWLIRNPGLLVRGKRYA
jgi:hypothetical protein